MISSSVLGAEESCEPVHISDVEVTEPLPTLAEDGRARSSALILVRFCSEPLGLVELHGRGEITPIQLGVAIWAAHGPAIRAKVAETGLEPPEEIPLTGLAVGDTVPYLVERERVLGKAPAVTVVVCTRDGGDRIAPCLISLDQQRYPRFDVVVVDNAPTTEQLAKVLTELELRAPVRRVVEQRPGLSWARNRGLAEATGEVVAYIDDDETADPHWLAELARGFESTYRPSAVSGPILPSRLETRAQHWFEQFGGATKGRGFTSTALGHGSPSKQSPLYPLPTFGSGGNMAFRRDALLQIGGFDVALGAGTPARAGEETAALSDLMLAGHRVVYQPGALVRHHHHEQLSDLARQLQGYGCGLGAFYTRVIVKHPRRIGDLVALVPVAARDTLGKRGLRSATMDSDFPPDLNRAELRGLLRGPLAYLLSIRCQRRVAAGFARMPEVAP